MAEKEGKEERVTTSVVLDGVKQTITVVEKRNMGKGRPRWYLTDDGVRMVEKMSSWGCTLKEIAAAMGIHVNTLMAQHNRKYLDPARERGLEAQKTSIRLAQKRIMESGSATMAMFLGKNYLGQSDKSEIQLTDKRVDDMTIEELAERLRGKKEASEE